MKIPKEDKKTSRKRIHKFMANGIYEGVISFILFSGITIFVAYILLMLY